MIRSSQLSIYGLSLINAMLANKDYNVLKNTTLNEKFKILPQDHIERGSESRPVYPRLNYIVIGMGGNNLINVNQGYKLSPHRVTDAALFQHLPFILRPIGEDIRGTSREKYRLRKELEINGKQYVGYYAKKISSIDYRPYNLLVTNTDGVDELKILDTNTDKFLNPQPYNKPTDKDIVLEQDTVINRFKIEFRLDETDKKELKNVLKVLDIGEDIRLTELGICQGGDTYAGGYLEAIDMQVAFFIDINIPLNIELNSTEKTRLDIELGGAEPFYR